MKDKQDVIQEFNELVNMTASELEKWLKSDDSNSAGWPKETEDGETVGHDSGRKIVEILKENPEKDGEKYTEDQIAHMRKVVSYCKRHLAQETAGNKEKSAEEVKKTKSYASLKNWGHDFLKAQGKGGGQEVEENKGADTSKGESKDEEEEEEQEEKTGDKRKASNGQSGPSKKRETQKGKAGKNEDEEEAEVGDEDMKEGEDDEEEDEEDEGEDEEQGDEEGKRKTGSSKQSNGHATRSTNGKATNDKSNKGNSQNDSKDGKDEQGQNGGTPKKGPKKGDTVSWNWGGGQPEGKVLDVKAEETTITTKKGNKVTRKGDAEDPAVVVDAGSSKAIKLDHELN